jgi:histidinol-phosphate phosphatase family protein
MDIVNHYLQQLELAVRTLSREDIWKVIDQLLDAWRKGRHIYIFGNGGSAVTAMHMASDLNKYPNIPGMPRFKALALSDNTALLTSLANDCGYENIFSEQLVNFLDPGDLVIAISTSGNSPNVLKAVQVARERGAICIGFSGQDGGRLKELVEICVRAPAGQIGQQEDIHMILDHVIVHTLRYLLQAEVQANGQTETRVAITPHRRAIFLDRDGVISLNRHDYVKSWEEFSFLPGAIESLRLLAQHDCPVIVVTNQSAIGRGLVSPEIVDQINRRMQDEIHLRGGRLDAVYTCPHRPDENCACRKPRPGLLHQAARQYQVDLERSYLIGDAISDIEAGLAAGCQPILVLTGRGLEHRSLLEQKGHRDIPVMLNISEAVQWIIKQNGGHRHRPPSTNPDSGPSVGR